MARFPTALSYALLPLWLLALGLPPLAQQADETGAAEAVEAAPSTPADAGAPDSQPRPPLAPLDVLGPSQQFSADEPYAHQTQPGSDDRSHH
ncbi:MAG: hypothetical protein OEZ06_31465 [Myxococcales bacterium]|nr:hypothetical protein [Myxococcales bacterium]